jgi:integrase family protein with SAM-like domain
MMDDTSALPVAIDIGPARAWTLDQLAQIPEEEIWLQKQKSPRTRRAYRLDVQHFMRTLAITAPEELRQADHKAVIAWERFMREVEHAASSTIRRRLAALSSLYKHLVRHGHAARNPVGEVEGRRSTATKARPSPSRKRRRANCSTCRRRIRSLGCATARYCRSACRSGCGAPRSPRSRSAICIRTAAMTRCA